MQKKKRKKRKEKKGGSNLLQTLKPQLGPVPEGRPEERAVLTSRWSALECPVLARIARDIPTLTNRAQLSHTTSLPILTANRRVGEEKGGGGVLHCCHPSCPRSGTINIIILGRSSAGQRAKTGNTDQTITSLKNKQV